MQVSRKPSSKGRWSTLGGARCPVRAEAQLAQGPLAPCVGGCIGELREKSRSIWRPHRLGSARFRVASRQPHDKAGRGKCPAFTLFRPSEKFLCFQHVVLRCPDSFS